MQDVFESVVNFGITTHVRTQPSNPPKTTCWAFSARPRDFFFPTGFLTGISCSFLLDGSRLWFTPQVLSPPLPPTTPPSLSLSFRVKRKQFVSLDICAFEVAPSALSSLSRCFPGQRQFPSLRGILKPAARKIHYSLCDTNKCEVSACIF